MNDCIGAIDVGNANLQFARVLVESLHEAGVVAAFLCPGSRSTPLALALAEHPGLLQGVYVDERAAAFQALGYAKATGKPVVLLCTSGTAGANFLPAVAEACHARVPLVVLTADRPPELRAWGAPQTMEQRFLYAGFTRWGEEAPCPGERASEIGYARVLGRRAVAEATGSVPGPVHLNLPFREPLLPAAVDTPGSQQRGPKAVVQGSGAEPDTGAGSRRYPGSESGGGSGDELGWEPGRELAYELGCRIDRATRGVLVFGPGTWDPSLGTAAGSLARVLGWPVLADPASGLRAGEALGGMLIHGADLLLRSAPAAKLLRPDLVVRFGGPPTSKAINEWIARHESAELWLVDEAGGFQDPQHRATRSCRANARQFCMRAASAAAELVDPDSIAAMQGRDARSWHGMWERADRVARVAADAAVAAEQRFLVPHLARVLWANVPAGAALYVAQQHGDPRDRRIRRATRRGAACDGEPRSERHRRTGVVRARCGVGAACAHGALVRRHRVAARCCRPARREHAADGPHDRRCQRRWRRDLRVPARSPVGATAFVRARCSPRRTASTCAASRGASAGTPGALNPRRHSRAALSRALSGGRHVIEVKVERAVNTAFHLSLHAAVGAALDREFTG